MMESKEQSLLNQQHVGGVAALYLGAAYLATIPYFLLVLDYPNATDPAAKLALLVKNEGSLYAFNLLAYVIFGLVLTVLALALHDRLMGESAPVARVVAGLGIMWACLLIASGTVSNMGMEYVVKLHATDAVGAASAWQMIESIANGLGGAGGEILGGPWVLLVSWAGLRSRRLPRGLSWLGVATGLVGLASNVPPLRDCASAFGLLQIPWFAWLGILLLRTKLDVAPSEEVLLGPTASRRPVIARYG
jgi:Domain of unknown function (DUF4386)